MLEIKINNEVLELQPGASVQITHSSPIFDVDSHDRAFTLPFKIPLTPRNKAIRKHKNRIDGADKSSSTQSECRLGGHLLLSGKMTQTGSSDESEEVSIANEPLKIWEKLRKIKINEILETFDLLDGRPDPVWEFGMGSTGSYQIVVNGFSASASAASFPDIAVAGASIASQLNTEYPGIAFYNSGSNRLELDAFLVQTNPVTSFTLFNLADYQNIALYHYDAVVAHVLACNATPIASHCFPMIKWDNFYGNKNFLFTPPYGYRVMNNVVDGVFLANLEITTPGELYWQNSVLPCLRVPYILTKIAESLGDYIWAGDIWADTDFQKLILVSNLTLDEVTDDIYDDLLTHKYNTFKTDLNLNNLVPTMNAADFISFLGNTFALYLSSADGVLSFVKKQTPLLVKPIDLKDKISKKFATDPNTVSGWKIAMNANENEVQADPAQLQSVLSGEGEYELFTANTLFMADSVKVSPTHFARMPHTNQPGRSPAFDTGATKSTMPLCLLFDHGLQPDSASDNYVCASHDGLNYDGDTVGAYSLSPEGEFGLYEQWHKHVIEYAVSDTLKVTGYFHAGDLQNLLQWKSARISFYHPEGGTVVAAIKDIRTIANSQGLQPTSLELLVK